MTYFKGCFSVKDIKGRYLELMKEHHPDMGGDPDVAKAINAELEKVLATAMSGHFQDWQDENPERDAKGFSATVFADVLKDIIDWNIRIEIIGYWIYAFDSYEYKDQLKERGFWWSKKHKAWIYSGSQKRRVKSRLTTRDVREIHGSWVVRDRENMAALPA